MACDSKKKKKTGKREGEGGKKDRWRLKVHREMTCKEIGGYCLKIPHSQCGQHQFYYACINLYALACVHMCSNAHAVQGRAAHVFVSIHFHSCWLTAMARPVVINDHTPNARVKTREGWACDVFFFFFLYSVPHKAYDSMCWYVFELKQWNHFIPRLCCLCAEAPLWAWCGMGICLWAILITSRNGKCLMCSGEVIDIDLCCWGLWRGSIIAGSRQSQLCIIRLGLCARASICVCAFVCDYRRVFDRGPAWKCHT